jgi:hypothetical protein
MSGGRCVSALRLRNDLARGLRASGAACERQQGDVARALDGDAEPALMTRADAGHTARKNLAALLDELRKNVGALVVDEIHLFDTKLADFLFAEILALAARAAAGAARTSAWSAFTTRTTVPAAWTMTTTAFAARRSTVRLRLFRIVCHCFLPFSLETGNAKFEIRNAKISWPRDVRLRLRARALVPEWESTPELTRVRCGAGDGRRVVRACR